MAKIKVAEASGVVLDWMVAKSKGLPEKRLIDISMWVHVRHQGAYRYQSDWGHGGPIIEQLRSDSNYQFLIESDGDNVHVLSWPSEHVHFSGYGPTILISAMRCYATSKLGEEVEVPDELLET